MQLILKRQLPDAEAQMGTLYNGADKICFTLEPGTASPKGAIPQGIYGITVGWSPHFGRPIPKLTNVPGFDAIEIHPGNTAKDTHGCILVGCYLGDHCLTTSLDAFEHVFQLIDDAIENKDDVTIEIINLN